MAAEKELTPMMAQYRRIKGELPKDALLLFRLGDFYEMFFEDAQSGAQILNLALTARNGIPMCGLPFHAANGYISKILRAGRKVAICEQLEDGSELAFEELIGISPQEIQRMIPPKNRLDVFVAPTPGRVRDPDYRSQAIVDRASTLLNTIDEEAQHFKVTINASQSQNCGAGVVFDIID